jgi:hypothetical protein
MDVALLIIMERSKNGIITYSLKIQGLTLIYKYQGLRIFFRVSLFKISYANNLAELNKKVTDMRQFDIEIL